jgi:pilus assembly protein CpaE
VALKVTLVGGEDRQVEGLLRECGITVTVGGSGGLSTLAQPSTPQPDVVVVDVRGHAAIPPGVAALRRQHSGTGIVILTRTLEPDLILAAMRAGANECVAEPFTPAELDAAITRIVAQSGPAVSQSFAIIGMKGGVGATSLAVNIASVLARVARANALLIDLHVERGDAALYLGVEPRFSVVDALENIQKLDDAFFRSLVTKAPSGLSLLAAPEVPSGMRLDASRVRALLEFTSKHFEFVVVDVPRTEPGAVDALDGMKSIVAALTQELPAVRGAAQLIPRLRARYGKERVLPVVSRLDRESDIGSEDLEKVLGGPVAHIVPSDYRRTLAALNKGRPVVLDNHSTLATSLEKFAHALAGLTIEKTRTKGGAEPAPWFARLGRRR